MHHDNRREFYRVAFHIPLTARFKIIGYNKNQVNTNSTSIYIVDISAGGLRMHTKLNMPVNDGLLLEFHFQLLNRDLCLLGSIVRKSHVQLDIYEYGIVFTLDDSTRDLLLSNIHTLSIRLRQSQVLASCSFSSEEEMKRFYQSESYS